MMVSCTPIVLDRVELEKKLQKHGFLNFGRFLTGGRPVTKIELKYVEYLILDYEMKLGKGLGAFLKGGSKQPETQRIRMIGNGSTGNVSFLEIIPPLETRDVPESIMQSKDFGPDDMKQNAKHIGITVCRKLTGKICREIELTKVSSIYRPFWAVYYGESREDGKVLCRPYAADGFTIKQ